jgi:hypothetical protein
VGGDGPLVMGGQGSGIFSAGTMFRSLLNIIPGGRSFPPRPSFNKHCQMSNQIRRVSDRTRCAAPFVRDPLTIKKHVSHARTQGLVSILATRRRDQLLGGRLLGKVRCVSVCARSLASVTSLWNTYREDLTCRAVAICAHMHRHWNHTSIFCQSV